MLVKVNSRMTALPQLRMQQVRMPSESCLLEEMDRIPGVFEGKPVTQEKKHNNDILYSSCVNAIRIVKIM